MRCASSIPRLALRASWREIDRVKMYGRCSAMKLKAISCGRFGRTRGSHQHSGWSSNRVSGFSSRKGAGVLAWMSRSFWWSLSTLAKSLGKGPSFSRSRISRRGRIISKPQMARVSGVGGSFSPRGTRGILFLSLGSTTSIGRLRLNCRKSMLVGLPSTAPVWRSHVSNVIHTLLRNCAIHSLSRIVSEVSSGVGCGSYWSRCSPISCASRIAVPT